MSMIVEPTVTERNELVAVLAAHGGADLESEAAHILAAGYRKTPSSVADAANLIEIWTQVGALTGDYPPTEMAKDVAATITQYVAGERERCAKICDGMAKAWSAYTARRCATAIRAGAPAGDAG